MAEELRAETSQLLKQNCSLKPSISRKGARALKELKQDKSRVILTVNKWVAMVVLDKQDYTNKAHDLLAQRNPYRPLTVDPTNKHKT